MLILTKADAKNYFALIRIAKGIKLNKSRNRGLTHGLRGKKMKLLQDQGYQCAGGCGKELDNGLPENKSTFEHIIPYRFGGTMSIHNLVMMCEECNQKADQEFTLDYIENHFGKIDWDTLRKIQIVNI